MSAPASLRVVLPSGRRVDAEIRGHVIHTDQPIDKGGEDAAPSPFELFLASIGTCAGIFIQGFCANRKLSSEGITIDELPEFNAEGVLRSVTLRVNLPAAFPDKYRAAIVKVAEQCSVKKAIAAQPEFRVQTTASP